MTENVVSHLPVTLQGNETIPCVKRVESAINEVSSAICKIQSSISDLTRVRDKCRIHIQQYDSDYKALQGIYESMKQRMSANEDFNDVVSQSQNKQLQQSGIQGKNGRDDSTVSNISGNGSSYDMIPSEPSQMSIVDIQWEIKPPTNLFNVRLRFALSTPAVLCSVQFDPQGKCIAFSDGKLLHVISSENGALMYSVEIPRSVSRNELHTRVIRFSHDGRLIAVSSMSSSVSIISTETRKCIGSLEGHKKTVSSLLFLKNNRLISGSYDGLLCVWDLQTMSLVKALQHGSESNGKLNKEGAIVSLATDSEESFILVGFMKGYVGIYEPSFTQPMNSFTAHNEYLLSVETVPNEPAIITTSQDKTAKYWQLHGVASCKHVFTAHRDYVICSTMAKQNYLLITGSKDETLRWWNRETGQELFSIDGHKNTLFEVHHHPYENSIVSCSGDGLVCMWDYTFPPLSRPTR